MAEELTTLGALRSRWAALPLQARVGIIALVIGLGCYAALSTWYSKNPSMSVLFSNLAEDDAARIVERLRAANVPYKLGEDGTTILVPDASVHETRLMLAGEGLPNGGGVGFEVFDTQRFGESEFSEQVKYHRALEGELARTISHLMGVARARVHLVMPSRSLFASDEPGASASVVLHLKPGFRIRDEQAKGIIHLVASSVRDLSPDRVTLVDGDGKPLGAVPTEAEQGTGDNFRREFELSKERSAQQLLDTTLGRGKSFVRVSAALNMAREEWTEERFDPQSTATRSFQTNEEKDGPGDNVVAGVPGSPSNLPGADTATTAGTQTKGGSRRSETRNFEISKMLRKAVEPVGRVTNMQVAVVVDGKWTGTGDKRQFEPLPQAELDRIAKIVTPAIGLDTKRGDKIVVECVPFPGSPHAEIEPEKVEVLPMKQIILGAAAAFLLLLLLLIRAVRKARKARGPEALPAPATLQQLALAAQQPQEQDPSLIAATELLSAKEAARNAPNEAVEQVRQMAADLASREPEAAARVIRGWLNEGKP